MSSDLISRLLQSPLAPIIAVAAILIFAAAITVALIVLRRRRVEGRLKHEAPALQREEEFRATVSKVPIVRSSEQLSLRVSNLFGEHLSQRVLAIYACRQGDERARNLLPEFVLTGTKYEAAIPRSIDSSDATQFTWPRFGSLAMITGARLEPTAPPPSSDLPDQGAAAEQPAGESEALKTGPLEGSLSSAEVSVLFLPWSGPFGWSGVIVAHSKDAKPESLAHYNEALAAIGDKLGVALELEQAEARLGDSSERSVSFSQAVLASLEEKFPIAFLMKDIAALLGAESAALWKADPLSNMVSVAASYGLKSSEFLPLPVGQGLAGSIVQTGDVLALEDAPSDPRCIFPREARESGIASYLGAPIAIDGKTVGVVEVHSSQHHQWSDVDRRMLQAAATVVGQFMKSADTRGNRLRVESAYLGLSEALQRLKSHDELLDAVVEVLGHALGVSRALVVELSDTGQPEPVRHEFHTGDLGPARGVNLGNLLVTEAVASENGTAIVIQDSSEKSLMPTASVADLQVKSEIAVPVRLEGTVRSIIYLHQCDRPRSWQPDEIEFVERVARQLSLSLMSVRAFDAISGEAQAAKEAARHAAAAQTRLQSLINALPESVLVLDAEGRLNYFNAKGRERFGFTNEDIGRATGIGDYFTSSDGRLWENVLASSQPARFEADLARAAAGSAVTQAAATAPQKRMPVSVSVTPFRASHGGPVVGRIVLVSDVSHMAEGAAGVSQKVVDLQQKITELESTIEQVRTGLRAAEEAELTARTNAEAAQQAQAEAVSEREQAQNEVTRYHSAAQQLLETNRLKSEFIVSAGHEIEASLQPVLGMLELLGQGQYGPLIPEQQEAIRNIYGWARRIKGDVDWLIEYGSARSRRLEPADKQSG